MNEEETEVLQSNGPLTRISICHSTVDDGHAVALVAALKTYPFTTEILLNHNQIGDIVRVFR